MADIPDQRHCYYGAMSTAAINALTTMSEGDTAYDSTLNAMKAYNGATWDLIGGGSGNTLDGAYDQGGSGAGRTITADNGAVEVRGAGGIITEGDVLPYDDDTQSLGSPSKRWNYVYSGDVILKNDWAVSELVDEEGDLSDPGGVVIKNKKGEDILVITDEGLYFKGEKIA